jgi:hypothetical protein
MFFTVTWVTPGVQFYAKSFYNSKIRINAELWFFAVVDEEMCNSFSMVVETHVLHIRIVSLTNANQFLQRVITSTSVKENCTL